MTALPAFATHVFKPRLQRYYLAPRTRAGGESLSGVDQTAELSGGGFWVFDFSDINLNTRELLKAYRAFEGLADGGVTRFIVPLCDLRQAPVPVIDGRRYYGDHGIWHSDDSPFGDNSGYAQPPIINAQLTGAAGVRATRISFTTDTGDIEGGEHFGVDHDDAWGRRLHRIVNVVSNPSPGAYTVDVRPPFRSSLATSSALDFVTPSCTMTVANAGDIAPTVEVHRFAKASVTFREAGI